MASPEPADVPRERPKLKLLPRNENAAAQHDLERQQSSKNPFGEARPREEILASKLGLSEEEILKEEARKTKVHLKLTREQLEQQKAAEDAVEEIRDQIANEEDLGKKETLQAELADRQEKLDRLIDHFAKLHFEAAQKGQIERPSQRRQQQQQQQPPPERSYSGGRGGYQTGYGGRSSYDRSSYNSYQSAKGGYGGRGGESYPVREGAYEGRNGGAGGGFGSYEPRGSYGGGRGSGYSEYGGGREGSQQDYNRSRAPDGYGSYGEGSYEGQRGSYRGGRGRGGRGGGRGRAGYSGDYESYGDKNGGYGYEAGYNYEYQSPYSAPAAEERY